MTSRDGRERVDAELPTETKQALREADVPMWKAIDQAVKMYYGLEENSTEEGYERRLTQLDEEISRVEEELTQLQEERDDLAERREHVQEQYDQFIESRESYESHLDDILDWMLENQSTTVYGRKNELREAARREYGTATREDVQEVIADLKDRAADEGLPIASHRFEESGHPAAAGQAGAADGDGTPQFRTLQEDDE